MRFALALILAALAFPAFAQEPGAAAWSYPQLRTPPAPSPAPSAPPQQPGQPLAEVPPLPPSEYVFPAPGPIDDGLPVRTIRGREVQPGQQHWVSANLGLFQPTAFRVGVKVLPRANGSLWLEGYWGSALFNVMYGFGARLQYTAHTFSGGDRIMVAPGAGMHILPNWNYDSGSYWGYYGYARNTLYWVYGDIDISWLHDFSPHFGFELGFKVGVAGLVGGRVGRHYPDFVMMGKGAYPIFGIYSGLRF
jgi:hypothetical protein